jgi:Macrocin-O-methyltransferase (TylF)
MVIFSLHSLSLSSYLLSSTVVDFDLFCSIVYGIILMLKYPLEFYIGNLYSRLSYLVSYQASDDRLFDNLHSEGLTLLSKYALHDLCSLVVNNAKNKIQGAIIETGCAKGGSSIALALTKDTSTPLFVYDVFGLIPPPSDKDDRDSIQRYQEIASGKALVVAGNIYYGYEENLYDKVSQSFESFGVDLPEKNVHLIQGLYQNTLQVSTPISIAHIDCDWYDSVILCLEKIHPFLVVGGTFVIDDYFSYSGCKSAVNDFFADKKNQYEFKSLSRLHVTKVCTV